MGRIHPFRSVLVFAAGLYGGLFIDQTVRVPPVANPYELYEAVLTILEAKDPVKGINVASGVVKWYNQLQDNLDKGLKPLGAAEATVPSKK